MLLSLLLLPPPPPLPAVAVAQCSKRSLTENERINEHWEGEELFVARLVFAVLAASAVVVAAAIVGGRAVCQPPSV